MKPYWVSGCGRHQVWHGDAYELARQFSELSPVLITDPPYEITASGGGMGAERKDLNATEGFTDCGFKYEVLDAFPNWVCFGTLRQVPKMIERVGTRRWMLVTWNKQNPSPLCNGNYLPDTEYIVHAWSSGMLFGDFKDKARYIVHPLGDKEHGEHPNEKPIRVMSKMVRLASPVNGLVVDLFAGSFSTAIACVRNGRRFIGCDNDERWCEVGANRIQQELAQDDFLRGTSEAQCGKLNQTALL